jgi:ubiquitin carboxyl-terminal hydrolase 4/11/15
MDPQSASFIPRDAMWRVQSEMSKIHQVQAQHSERLNRLERRQDDDARNKSIWGPSSPFPSILAGTPRQRPVEPPLPPPPRPPPADAFNGFDGQPTSLAGSVHLGPDDEPRRGVGTASRANSVRFDETAKQGHSSHHNRPSVDLLPRSGSSLGSHPLMERTLSHKSDGRQSSAGHPMASRANSSGTSEAFLSGLGSPAAEGPPTMPGLSILGPCPSIIRCWLTAKFQHASLLYAAVCCGSYSSCISRALVEKLGLSAQIRQVGAGGDKVKLNMYLPEAVVRSSSSAPARPTPPPLPSMAIDFTVVPDYDSQNDKMIRIVLGSVVLKSRHADVLLSSNTLVIYDDSRSRLSVPLVRPEDDRAFTSLRTTGAGHVDTPAPTATATATPLASIEVAVANGKAVEHAPSKSPVPEHEGHKESEPLSKAPQTATLWGRGRRFSNGSAGRPHNNNNNNNNNNINNNNNKEKKPMTEAQLQASHAMWNNWRREPDTSEEPPPTPTQPPWGHNRREQGMKVLRPAKISSRTFSGVQSASSPNPTQSRYFEEGKRRSSGEKKEEESEASFKKHVNGGAWGGAGKANGNSNAGNSNGAGAAGAGSAFSWLSKD